MSLYLSSEEVTGRAQQHLCNHQKQAPHFGVQFGNGIAVVRQMPLQAFLEQPVEQRIERTLGNGRLLAAEFGEPGRDAPHHIFQNLIDLEDVISKRVLELRPLTPRREFFPFIQDRVSFRQVSKQMHIRYALWLCAALVSLQSPAGAQSEAQFDPSATKRAAQEAEREWLEHEIGRFASGRDAVFSGEVKVTQRDQDEITVVEGSALATLSPGAPRTLTIVFPDRQRWLRLTQDPGRPDVTDVTRLRALHANTGVSAACTDCMAPFADLAKGPILLRVAAEGELLDVAQSRFLVEVAGSLRRIPPERLRLDQILPLSTDIATWRRRPDAPLNTQGRRGSPRGRSLAAPTCAAPGRRHGPVHLRIRDPLYRAALH